MGLPAIALAEEATVGGGVAGVQVLVSIAAGADEQGQKAQDQAVGLGLIDDKVHVIPVVVFCGPFGVLAGRDVGSSGIAVDEGEIAGGVRPQGAADALLAHDDGRLNHGEALPGAGPQVQVGVLARRDLEEQPGGIAQPEERRAVAADQVTAVLAHLQV